MKSKPAILGGKPLTKKGFDVSWPEHGAPEVKAVTRVAKSGNWWRYGGGLNETAAFEKAFAKYHDAKHCLAIANGTVAIEAALKAVGMQPGDEVIVPAVTFIATASAVNMASGVPVFADCVRETLQLDAKDVERKITKRTTGIVTVHYGGYPSDLDALKRVARKHKLFLIEDCAHAQGTAWRGRRVGAQGDAGTFSFQMSKSLTAGEGGAIITNNAKIHDAAEAYHMIGRSLGGTKYDYQFVGPNYRQTEWQSAILREQLKRLPDQNRRRQATKAYIDKALKSIPGICPLKADKRITARGFYFYILRFDERMWGISRSTFTQALKAEGLAVGQGYGQPVYQTKVYQDFVYDRMGNAFPRSKRQRGMITYRNVVCPTAEHVCAHEQLTFTTHTLLKKANGKLLVDGIAKLWENRDALQAHEAKSSGAKVRRVRSRVGSAA